MTKDEALTKLISVRHHCFVRGVRGQHPDGDFRAAFRDVDRLYVAFKAESERGARAQANARRAHATWHQESRTSRVPGWPRLKHVLRRQVADVCGEDFGGIQADLQAKERCRIEAEVEVRQ